MKVWIVWASNGESYEDNNQDIWSVCSSEEAAKRCIANAHEQILRDGVRYNELIAIESTRDLTESETTELDRIIEREYCVPWDRIVPNFTIREYEMIN